MSIAEFLRWQELQGDRYELIDGEPVLHRIMTRASQRPCRPDKLASATSFRHGDRTRTKILGRTGFAACATLGKQRGAYWCASSFSCSFFSA